MHNILYKCRIILRDSFACEESQLVEVFAGLWECTNRVQCLLKEILARSSAFDNGKTRVDDNQRTAHHSISTVDSISRFLGVV